MTRTIQSHAEDREHRDSRGDPRQKRRWAAKQSAAVIKARERLGLLKVLRQYPQPEALLAGLAVREPWHLEGGGQLADLTPDEFRARPEYGEVLDIVRALLEHYDAPTVAREIATNPAPYFVDHEQLALALLHDAPIAYNVPAVLAGIRERNRVENQAIAALDLARVAGWEMNLDRMSVKPPHEEPVRVPGRRYEPYATAESTAAELAAVRGDADDEWDADRTLGQLSLGSCAEEPKFLYELRHCTKVTRHARYSSRRELAKVTPAPCGTRTCPGCGPAIAERIVLALDAYDGALFHTMFTGAERRAVVERVKRRQGLYKLFPYKSDGGGLIISTVDIGPEVDRDDLPRIVGEAFAQTPASRNVSGSRAWSHAAATLARRTAASHPRVTSEEAEATNTRESAPVVNRGTPVTEEPVREWEHLGRVRVNVLTERTIAVGLTGTQPVEKGEEYNLDPARRQRIYSGVTEEIRDALVAAWRVESPEEFGASMAAARTLTRAKAVEFARRAAS